MSAVDVEAMKGYLRLSNDDETNLLQGFIDAAEALIANRIGPLTPTSVTTRVPGGGTSLVLRSTAPLISLTSVVNADGTVISASTLWFDTEGGAVYTVSGGRLTSRAYVVTYVAGWATLPADITMAIKEQVRHLWQTQRGPTAGRGAGSDALSPTASYAMPNRVMELLAPYVVPKVA